MYSYQVTWNENWKKCCALGLTPLSLDGFTATLFFREVQNGSTSIRLVPSNILIIIITVSVNEELASRVYWTGATTTGCAGKYTDCFEEGVDESYRTTSTFYSENLIDPLLDGGGACVAVALLGTTMLSKTMPCQSKLFLSCYGQRHAQNYTNNVRIHGHIAHMV